jgi:tRNA(fMet)-specific endonuclease VapC
VHFVDSAFLIDLSLGHAGASEKVRELESRHERLGLSVVVLSEFLVGAYSRGGKQLTQAIDLVSQFEIYDVTEPIAVDAARLGGECARRGTPASNLDLLIASTARHHRAVLLTRDNDFARIPGVTVEGY